MSDERRPEILETNDELAGRALRTLGMAFRSVPAGALADDELDERIEHDLVFAGLIGMIDPPRDEAERRRGTCERRRNPSAHDHRRSSEDRGGHRRRAGHRARSVEPMTGAELQRMSDEVLSSQTIRRRVGVSRV